MLASRFLSVVINEGDGDDAEQLAEPDSPISNASSDFNPGDNSVIQDLEAVCKLPDVLLAECTIKLVSPEDKLRQANRQCRFEAYVTPIQPVNSIPHPKPKLQPVPLAKLQGRWKEPDEDPLSQPQANIEDLLQGVEAVYSDEEEGNEAGRRNIYRKIKCTTCGRSFFRRCSVTTNTKSQQNISSDKVSHRAYQCKVCGKVYSQPSVLKKHEAVHSGYRLRCKVCGIDFTQRSSLLRHCKRIHGIANDSEIPTPLVRPDLRMIPKIVTSTPQPKIVSGLPDRLTALLKKKEDSITLAVSKRRQRMGPYTLNPHTVMTITPDVIIQTEQE